MLKTLPIVNCQNQDVELQMLNHLGINILPDEGNKLVLIISLPPISSNHYTVKFPLLEILHQLHNFIANFKPRKIWVLAQFVLKTSFSSCDHCSDEENWLFWGKLWSRANCEKEHVGVSSQILNEQMPYLYSNWYLNRLELMGS